MQQSYDQLIQSHMYVLLMKSQHNLLANSPAYQCLNQTEAVAVDDLSLPLLRQPLRMKS
jgi:hypothetical protein